RFRRRACGADPAAEALMPDPHAHKILDRKQRHAALNDFITERGGWLTSVPGDPLMRFEAPIGAGLAEQLRAKGYIVTPAGSTTRIDPHAIAVIIQADVYDLMLPPGALP